MNVGSKQVVESLSYLAFVGLGVYCLHNGAFMLKEITPLQERVESENRNLSTDT